MDQRLWKAPLILGLLVGCGPRTATPQGAEASKTPAHEMAPKLRLSGDVVPVGYAVELALDPDDPGFSGVATIELDVKSPVRSLWLNGSQLTVTKATVKTGGKRFTASVLPTSTDDFLGFRLPQPLAKGPATLVIEYGGNIEQKDYVGIFRQKEDDKNYLYTQFESLGARRAFPCFDEPRFKVPFQLTIRAQKDLVVATNTPALTETVDEATGEKTVVFAETPPLPSYLVALAVGPFDVLDIGTGGRQDISMRILTPAGKASEAAYAAKVTGTILERLEDYFDMPYPYAKLDSVAVPHFLGAMENPGLITYASSLLLAKRGEETVGQKRGYASVAAHELAHQWFGNLVTLSWWDDLWLNESFATWMAAKVIAEWQPEWHGNMSRVGRVNGSMRSDSLMSARKIRQPIKSNHDIYNAFDGISYGKGASVLAMFESWIGPETFRQAVQSYLRKHAWKTATADDFLASIAEIAVSDVPDAFSTFLDQPGVPLVSFELVCSGATPELRMKQERFLPAGSEGIADAQTWHVPVCVRYGSGKSGTRQCTLLTEREGSLDLETSTCPKWLVPNDGAMGYYRAHFAGTEKALKVASGPERLSMVGDLRALVTANRAPLGELASLVPSLAKDRRRHIAQQAIAIADSMEPMVSDELRPKYESFVRKTFGAQARRLGFTHRRRDSEDTRLLRPALLSLVGDMDPALQKRATRLAQSWLEGPLVLPPDVRGVALRVAARAGDKELYEAFATAAAEEPERRRRTSMLRAMASFIEPPHVQRNLDLFLEGTYDFRESGSLMRAPLSEPALRPMVWQYVQDNYQALTDLLPKLWGRSLFYTAVPFCDREHMQEAQAFFKDKVAKTPGGPRSFAQAMESMRLCIAYREAQTPSLNNFLEKQ